MRFVKPIIAGLFLLAATLASTEPEAETTLTEDLFDQMQDSFRNLADEVLSSLVFIEAATFAGGAVSQSSIGSGFIVEHDADNNSFYVATNHHVAGGPDYGAAGPWDAIRVITHDGRTFDAALVGTDPRYDVALISFQHSTDDIFDWSPSVAMIGDSDAVQAGDLVYAVGAPGTLTGVNPETVTLGIVSNASREGPSSIGEFIQTDASINPGNSGGPLVSLRDGKVIGINTHIALAPVFVGSSAATGPEGPAYVRGNIGIGFAVPINTAMRIIANLKDHGTPRHGYIGVEYSPRGATDVLAACPDDPEDAELNVDEETWAMIMSDLTTIMDVTPLAPADRYGLKPGDVILLVDGELASVVADVDRPSGYKELVRMVDALTPGTDSTFEVFRDCDFVEITVQAGAREEQDAGDWSLASWPGMLLGADLTVLAVAESGVAASLGIEEGDKITHVNEDQLDTLVQFYQTIDTCRIERCSLGVYRNGFLSWSPDFMVPRQ